MNHVGELLGEQVALVIARNIPMIAREIQTPLDKSDVEEPETKVGVEYRAFADSLVPLVKPKFVLYIPPLSGDRRQGYRFIGKTGASFNKRSQR
jgi:hypothetical protein